MTTGIMVGAAARVVESTERNMMKTTCYRSTDPALHTFVDHVIVPALTGRWLHGHRSGLVPSDLWALPTASTCG